jgi:hypothetical protein
MFRATGRGFGRGIFAQACTASAEHPIASARHVAKAVDRTVDRKAAARTNEVTEFLRGESFNGSSPSVI